MLEQLSDGTIKRVAARDYLIDHLLTFSPETHVGLRAYGHRVPWQQKQDSCQDIQLIAPVETGQMEAIAAWLQNFQTQGMTPIYAAVDQAFGDFNSGSTDHLNNIILISDGIETCGGDPCDLVEAAKTKGINFTIHVVGLNVDNNARTQLSCMAAKGGGIYYDVHNGGELKDALHSVQQDVKVDEQIKSFAEATAAAMPTDTPVPPTPTQTSTLKPIPTNTRTLGPTRTPVPTRTPRPITPTATKKSSCALPNIIEFKAVPPPQGSTARFTLQYQVQGAVRLEIFGNVLPDPQQGTFDVWDSQTNYWVLWAINTCGDWTEKAIQVEPDKITPPGPGFTDVTVSQRNIVISVRDNAAIDGDRIKLIVNGQVILPDITLGSDWYGVSVDLNPGENTVEVQALNEGYDSPNTVEVMVSHVVSGSPIQVSRGMYTGEIVSFKIHAP
jgi:hypothetical protein